MHAVDFSRVKFLKKFDTYISIIHKTHHQQKSSILNWSHLNFEILIFTTLINHNNGLYNAHINSRICLGVIKIPFHFWPYLTARKFLFRDRTEKKEFRFFYSHHFLRSFYTQIHTFFEKGGKKNFPNAISFFEQRRRKMKKDYLIAFFGQQPVLCDYFRILSFYNN